MNRGRQRWSRFRWSMRCFNEAPIHESGKDTRSPEPVASNQRFNEAPIHESGKIAPPPRKVSPPCGFNEAPIHESGKP